MATGEAKRLAYKPGMERPRTLPIDNGDYVGNLLDYGKKGLAGWNKKPGKYPNRKLSIAIQGTEDEVSGGEKKVTEYLTANPKAFFRVFDLAAAVNYQEEFDIAMPAKETSPEVREICNWIDSLLEYIKDNDIPLNVSIGQEEYQGEKRSRITKWLPADETVAANDEEPEAEEEETPEEEEAEIEEEPEEEEKPKAPARKAPAAKAPAKKTGKK